MKIIDQSVLDELSAAARQSPRLRKNHNLHECDDSACHRLFNAMEPASYIRPHRHLNPEKSETIVIMRGSLRLIAFDDSGTVTKSVLLCAGENLAVDVPYGEYHTALSLESGTIFLEVKSGPYLPLSAEEKADFAPEEGSAEAAFYLEKLKGMFL